MNATSIVMSAYFGAIIRKRKELHERNQKSVDNLLPPYKATTYQELISKRKSANKKHSKTISNKSANSN